MTTIEVEAAVAKKSLSKHAVRKPLPKQAAKKQPPMKGSGAVTKAGSGAISAPAKKQPANTAPVTPSLYLSPLHETSLAQFAISGKSTGLRLDVSVVPSSPPNLLSDDDKSNSFFRRYTSAWSASEPLVVADAPIDDVVWNTDLWLDRMVIGLAIGQSIALVGTTATIVDDLAGPGGKSAQSTGVEAREIVELAAIFHSRGRTRLVLQTPLEHAYLRATVTINANVAEATHGETVSREVLGNGDGSRANQTFSSPSRRSRMSRRRRRRAARARSSSRSTASIGRRSRRSTKRAPPIASTSCGATTTAAPTSSSATASAARACRRARPTSLATYRTGNRPRTARSYEDKSQHPVATRSVEVGDQPAAGEGARRRPSSWPTRRSAPRTVRTPSRRLD